MPLGLFRIFQKFAFVFPAQGLPPVSTTGGKICRRCLWHRWQIFRRCRWYRRKFCRRCRWYRWCTFTYEYFREFSKKFETVWMGYSGAGGKLIHEKNQKQKILWQCPFNASKFLPWLSYYAQFPSAYSPNTLNFILRASKLRLMN